MVRRLKKKSKQTFEMVYVVLFVLLCIAGSLGVARRMSLPASVVSFASVAHQPQNTRVYLDVRVDGQHAGRLEVELFDGLAPKTAANFRALCVGAGQTSYGLSKTYSIYPGNEFADEWDNGMLRHDRRGLLSMANAGPDTQTSQFFLTLGATGALDGKHVVFGVVARGLAVLDAIEAGGTSSGAPVKRVVISAAGAL
ncbi:peptidyl-prolyl cis-trans isomerase [Aureococcus anophagefferens]|nr:peptidyl-prolyl cis-trans isomerase [Aureococcus anophagefferens]